jgi:hypothetical protein
VAIREEEKPQSVLIDDRFVGGHRREGYDRYDQSPSILGRSCHAVLVEVANNHVGLPTSLVEMTIFTVLAVMSGVSPQGYVWRTPAILIPLLMKAKRLG